MSSKHKGDNISKLFVVVVIIVFMHVILSEMNEPTPISPNMSLISELRNARAAGIMFLSDDIDMTFDQIISIWSGLNTGNTNFGYYTDNPRKVKDYSFTVVPDPETREIMLLVGKRISDPKLASKMIDLAGTILLGPTGHAFTSTDSFVYIRVK